MSEQTNKEIAGKLLEEVRTSPYIPVPHVLGKFNFLSYGPGKVNIIFCPFEGSGACIVARNLTLDEAQELIDILNEELDETKKIFDNRKQSLKRQLRSRHKRNNEREFLNKVQRLADDGQPVNIPQLNVDSPKDKAE